MFRVTKVLRQERRLVKRRPPKSTREDQQPRRTDFYPRINLATDALYSNMSNLGPQMMQRFSYQEQITRIQLSSCFQLFSFWEWDRNSIYGHLTAKIRDSSKDEFLIQPFGLSHNEVSGSSLVKVNYKGDILESGSTNLSPNKAGVLLHSSIYKAKPNINCILHGHMSEAVAVSCTELLPISQVACCLGKVGYHDYHGIVQNPQDQHGIEKLVKDLGDHKVLFLRNHGVLTCGKSIQEAMVLMKNTMDACAIQVLAHNAAAGNALKMPDEKYVKQAYEQHQQNLDEGLLDLEFSNYLRLIDNGSSPLMTEL
jgi:ribulose-5-phosphate 4-epimerase/fuculose-1-phosphate aldolase